MCRFGDGPVPKAPTGPWALVMLSDYLFLNKREFSQLANVDEAIQSTTATMGDTDIATRIYRSLNCASTIIVLKSYYRTKFFQRFRRRGIPGMPDSINCRRDSS